MNVELHIEELVLHGFKPGDRHQISGAMEAELSRLFTKQGIPPGLENGGTIPALNVGAFNIAPGAKPGAIGAQVAQAVYGGLTK